MPPRPNSVLLARLIGLVEVIIFMDGDDRAEDLFAGHAHFGGDIGEHGGLDEESLGEFAVESCWFATGGDACTFGFGRV